MTYHKTKNIVIKSAHVDELMIPLVQELNKLNAVFTLHCCQGEEEGDDSWYEHAYLHLFVMNLQCPVFQEIVAYFAINENAKFESSLCIRPKVPKDEEGIHGRMHPHIKGSLVIRFPHNRIAEITKNIVEIVSFHQVVQNGIAEKVVDDEKTSSPDKPSAKIRLQSRRKR